MSGKQLETVKEHKDLGVLVDSELKFHHPVRSAIVLSTFRVRDDHTPKFSITSGIKSHEIKWRIKIKKYIYTTTSPAAAATPAQEDDKKM